MRVGHRDTATLVAPALPPVRCTEELAPVTVTRVDDTTHLLDFGQNLVGRLRVRVQGPAGHVVALRHAEVLEHGELGIRPLRLADAQDLITLDGGEPRFWEPKFTFHGFRYATVTGLDEIGDGDVVARVIHSDMRCTGWLETSNPDLNRLHENVRWGMRGNFLSIPTDCPQRDERLGWTGDVQVFAPTASFLYDSAGFLESWLTDVALEQLPDGTIPWFVPVIPGGPTWNPIPTGAVWGDVSVLTPWTLHERFGDLEVLRRQYDSGRKWVERMIDQSGPSRLWRDGHQLGDWLDRRHRRTIRPTRAPTGTWSPPHTSPSRRGVWPTPPGSSASRPTPTRYARIAEEARDAFRAEYVRGDGTLTSDAQTAYALAIRFGLLSVTEEAVAGRRSRRARPRGRQPHRDGLRRDPGHQRCAVADRARRHGVRPDPRDRVPVVAVHRAHGRDDDLGALGLDAPGRIDQSGRDDQLQPLRSRKRRGLDAPRHRGALAGRTRIPSHRVGTAARG